MDVSEIQTRLRQFSSERDWDQFHSPKNLAMALAAEAGELVELFQWLTEAQSMELAKDESKLSRVGEEVADVLIYLLRLTDKLGIDLDLAVEQKIHSNAEKYPVELAKGNSLKYTEFGDSRK